jgi:hypothetical protein
VWQLVLHPAGYLRAGADHSPAGHCEPDWWRGHSPLAVCAVVLLVVMSAMPFIVGYALAPPGKEFTGALAYPQDDAQHEAWAAEMAMHVGFINVLTPEATARGWFISPIELVLGLSQRITGISYPVLRNVLGVACAPFLAFGLMTLARRSGVGRPGLTAVLALLVGPLVPVLHLIGKVASPALASVETEMGADATPIYQASQGPGLYLLLGVLVLIALPRGSLRDPTRGFRWAGAAVCVVLAIYPFFGPALGLTAGLCALAWARQVRLRTTLRRLAWLAGWTALPLAYWVCLPFVDAEFASFEAANRPALFSIDAVLLNLGLASGALVGVPRLLRGNAYQQTLAWFSVSTLIALFTPGHPWRSHLYYFSPVLVIAACAAWWPALAPLASARRRLLVAFLGALCLAGIPFYYARYISSLLRPSPPAYLAQGDLDAARWLASHDGASAVLARGYVSPWVAARGHHHVLIGHALWTHQYLRRVAEVEAAFASGLELRSVLLAEHVAWVLVDGDNPPPSWTQGIEPTLRFGSASLFSADALLEAVQENAQADADSR